MLLKIGALRKLQFYYKETPTQVFSCEICESFNGLVTHIIFAIIRIIGEL